MAVTMENLFYGVTSIYAFTPIVMDSLNSVQENYCGLAVHEVKVDLQEDLQQFWQEMALLLSFLGGVGLTSINLAGVFSSTSWKSWILRLV